MHKITWLIRYGAFALLGIAAFSHADTDTFMCMVGNKAVFSDRPCNESAKPANNKPPVNPSTANQPNGQQTTLPKAVDPRSPSEWEKQQADMRDAQQRALLEESIVKCAGED